MWIGYTDNSDHQVHVATLPQDGSYNDTAIPHAYSYLAPAIAAYNGDLYVAYTGEDGHLNVLDNSNYTKTVLSDTSGLAPSLNAENGLLDIAWTGTGNQKLNISSLGVSSSGTVAESCKQSLAQTSNTARQ